MRTASPCCAPNGAGTADDACSRVLCETAEVCRHDHHDEAGAVVREGRSLGCLDEVRAISRVVAFEGLVRGQVGDRS